MPKFAVLMLGQGGGGIEQAAIDCSFALSEAGAWVQPILHPKSWAAKQIQQKAADKQSHTPITPFYLSAHGNWDPIAIIKLAHYFYKHQIDSVICRGNRALSLALSAKKMLYAFNHKQLSIMAFAENYKLKRFRYADACVASTHHLKSELESLNIPAHLIYHIPNIVSILPRGAVRPAFHNPVKIGAMGRFVHKKGFEVYIQALAILSQRGIEFEAFLGGEGEEESHYQTLIQNYGLEDQLKLTGWVEDRHTFFDPLDLFILPSHHEPFGIIVLEAMAARLPIISTKSEGPSEIISHESDGLLTPINDASALADAMVHLINHPQLAQKMGDKACETLKEFYTPSIVAKKIIAAAQELIEKHK